MSPLSVTVVLSAYPEQSSQPDVECKVQATVQDKDKAPQNSRLNFTRRQPHCVSGSHRHSLTISRYPLVARQVSLDGSFFDYFLPRQCPQPALVPAIEFTHLTSPHFTLSRNHNISLTARGFRTSSRDQKPRLAIWPQRAARDLVCGFLAYHCRSQPTEVLIDA